MSMIRFSSLALDPEKWDELKDGINYSEKALEEMAYEPSMPFGLATWWEMVKILALIILAIGLIYLIIRLLGGVKINKVTKAQKANHTVNDKPITALSPMDLLWDHFNKARAAGNYREALRILHQIALKKLSVKGYLVAEPDKTNGEYLRELNNHSLREPFRKLTLIQEHTWYGDSGVDSKRFSGYESRFMDFINTPELE